MEPLFIAAAAALGDKLDSAFFDFDMWAFSFFGHMQNTVLTYVAKFFTAFGDENFIIPMVVLAIILCFFKKTRKIGFSLLFAIIIGTLVTNVIVKPTFMRMRPYNTLQTYGLTSETWLNYREWYFAAGALSESDYSFPSGHTTGAFEMAVAFALYLREKGKKGLSFVPPAVALCTMGSRVYLMVHYATDVIGGLIIGTLAGVCGFFLAKLVCSLFAKSKALDSIDAGKLIGKIYNKVAKKKIKNPARAGLCAALAFVFVFFLVAYVPAANETSEGVVRCEYNIAFGKENGLDVDYDCFNAAKTDEDKYPELKEYKGKHFCKIHYKQLSGETE